MKRIIQTDKAPQAIGPYSQAIEADGHLYISGQIPLDAQSGEVMGNDIQTQCRQVMQNIGAILEAAGYSFADVVKSTCLLKNMDDFQAMNAVYAEYYPEEPPARAAFEVARLPKDVLIEIETIAVKL